jgi:hypothetical protein
MWALAQAAMMPETTCQTPEATEIADASPQSG